MKYLCIELCIGIFMFAILVFKIPLVVFYVNDCYEHPWVHQKKRHPRNQFMLNTSYDNHSKWMSSMHAPALKRRTAGDEGDFTLEQTPFQNMCLASAGLRIKFDLCKKATIHSSFPCLGLPALCITPTSRLWMMKTLKLKWCLTKWFTPFDFVNGCDFFDFFRMTYLRFQSLFQSS